MEKCPFLPIKGDIQKWSLIGPPACYFLICHWKKMVPRPLFYVFLPTELVSGVKLRIGSLPGVKKRGFFDFFQFFSPIDVDGIMLIFTNQRWASPIKPWPLVRLGSKLTSMGSDSVAMIFWDFQDPDSMTMGFRSINVTRKWLFFLVKTGISVKPLTQSLPNCVSDLRDIH